MLNILNCWRKVSAVGLFFSHWVCPFVSCCTVLGLWSRDKWLIVTLLNVLIEMCVCLPPLPRTIFMLLLLFLASSIKISFKLALTRKKWSTSWQIVQQQPQQTSRSYREKKCRLTNGCICRGHWCQSLWPSRSSQVTPSQSHCQQQDYNYGDD